jgi:RNA polymerase sigma-70 factor (ECF subfamily)
MSIENEAQVIEKAKQGDENALKTLVDEYAPVIFKFAWNVCRDQDRAENTTQETLLSVLRKLDQFDNRSKFSTWLYTIVSNHCMMAARSAKADRYVSLDNDESPIPELATTHWSDDPLSKLERKDTRAHIDEAIAKLSPDYRLIFILRDIQELPTEEVAQITGLSVAAVKSRLHRARAFLRDALTPLFSEQS